MIDKFTLNREVSQGARYKFPYVTHYLAKGENLPIWASVGLMSFGTLSKIYRNIIDTEIAKALADEYGLKIAILANWRELIPGTLPPTADNNGNGVRSRRGNAGRKRKDQSAIDEALLGCWPDQGATLEIVAKFADVNADGVSLTRQTLVSFRTM